MGFFSNLKNLISPPQVDYQALVKEGAVIIDVRTKEEYRGGSIKKSKNIPLHTLEGKIAKLKGKDVILVCRSGARAGRAKAMLSKANITAYNAGSWQNLRGIK